MPGGQDQGKDVMMQTHDRQWDQGCIRHGGGPHECYRVVKVQDGNGKVRRLKHLLCRCFCGASIKYRKS